MMSKLSRLSPFGQVLVLILIGAVAFSVLSVTSTIIVQQLYPEIPANNISALYRSFPVQFMFLFYLPFQVGFLLVPGVIYATMTKGENAQYVGNPSIQWIIWALLLFSSTLLALPFFSSINEWITRFFGVFDELWNQKILSDQQFTYLFGKHASLSSLFSAFVFIGIITGIAEEFAFRRFLFRHMLMNTNKLWLSIIASAFFFALLHFNYLQFIPLFIFGIVLAMIYHGTGSIWPGVVAHALNNCLNVYWLRSDSFPKWMENNYPEITIPSILIMMGLIWYKYFKK